MHRKTLRPSASGQITASKTRLGKNFTIAPGSRILCNSFKAANNVIIGPNVDIVAGGIILGDECKVLEGARITVVEELEIGICGTVGRNSSISGRSIKIGSFFWCKDNVVIGGGGSMGPDARLVVGDHVSIFDRSYVNLSDEVHIGNDCALSANVTILTHGAWQPVLDGYPSLFARVVIEQNVVIYVNSTVLPGVTIGESSTVAAGSVVAGNVPPRSLAGGVPAHVIRDSSAYPARLSREQKQSFIIETLCAYAATLSYKGVEILENQLRSTGRLVVSTERGNVEIVFPDVSGRRVAPSRSRIVVSFRSAPPGSKNYLAWFDLSRYVLTGGTDSLSEDLRDFLRRSAIKFFPPRRFKTLQPKQLQELLCKRR